MSLKDALENCLITFDSRVLVSDLLEEYKLTYKEVQDTLSAHIAKVEKSNGTKFEKRFIVHGEEKESSAGQQPHDIFTIVQGESKLTDWLKKLKNAETLLYSVQIAGGAKAPAHIFKPLQHCATQPKHMAVRDIAAGGTKSTVTNGNTTAATPAVAKIANTVKQEPPASKHKVESKPEVKKTSPQSAAVAKKSSPTENKAKPAAKKGSINNFFSATPAVKKEEPKEAKTLKPTTPKKMEDFFKKQAEKPAVAPVAKVVKSEVNATNTSIQLFDDDEDNASASSSDEEEKLEVLRRDVITGDFEPDDDEDPKPATNASKRRRILDSDDEDEQPQQKKQEQAEEKHDETMDVDEEDAKNQSETYLDDDGFVITIKSKKSNVVKRKTSPKQQSATTAAKKTTPPNAAPPKTSASAAKTKQVNIMSFFSKK